MRPTTCPPMRSAISVRFECVRSTTCVCVPLHAFQRMRSTIYVPLHAFHRVLSAVLSEWMRSTTCAHVFAFHYVLSIPESECFGPSYKPKHIRTNLYWIQVQTENRQSGRASQCKFVLDPRINQNPQEPFVLESRTNRKQNAIEDEPLQQPLVLDSRAQPTRFFLHSVGRLHSDYFPSTFRLRSVYVPSTFRPHAFAAMHISPSAFECVRSTTCVP